MSLLQAYLQKPSTQRALSRKPGDKGFSLIELVIVVAVLAILTAIAIPAFNGVAEKGRDSAGRTNLAQAAKECAADRAINGGSGAHTALLAGNGLTFSSGLTGTTCPSGSSIVCVDNTGAQKQYAINLATGAKVAGGTTITAVSPCTATTTDAW